MLLFKLAKNAGNFSKPFPTSCRFVRKSYYFSSSKTFRNCRTHTYRPTSTQIHIQFYTLPYTRKLPNWHIKKPHTHTGIHARTIVILQIFYRYARTVIHKQEHTHTHTPMHTRTHTHTHTHTDNMFIYIYIYIYSVVVVCTRQDLCIQFAIDSADGLGDSFLLELDLVRKFVQMFGNNIGPGKTQYVTKHKMIIK